MEKIIRRGEIYIANLNPFIRKEMCGIQPVIVLQADNSNSLTTIVAPISNKTDKKQLFSHVNLNSYDFLAENSKVLLEQLRVIDKGRLNQCLCQLSEREIAEINAALSISVGLGV